MKSWLQNNTSIHSLLKWLLSWGHQSPFCYCHPDGQAKQVKGRDRRHYWTHPGLYNIFSVLSNFPISLLICFDQFHSQCFDVSGFDIIFLLQIRKHRLIWMQWPIKFHWLWSQHNFQGESVSVWEHSLPKKAHYGLIRKGMGIQWGWSSYKTMLKNLGRSGHFVGVIL